MDPEEQIPKDNEPEGNTPEEQGQALSNANAFPGRSAKRAQQAYNAYKTPKRIRNARKMARRSVRSTRAAAQAARVAAQAAAQAARVAAQAAASAAASIVAAVGLPIIIVIIIIIIIFLMVFPGDNPTISSNAQISSSGPIQAKIGDKLDYIITVNYPGTAQNTIITDQIPAGTKYVNAPNANYNPTTNTVTWNLADIINSTPGSPSAGVNTTLSLTLLATKDNDYIVNILNGTIQNGVLGANDSQPSTFNSQLSTLVTPTVFQLAPTTIPVSPQDANVIKSCVVTKVGDPVIIPSLPPECTNF